MTVVTAGSSDLHAFADESYSKTAQTYIFGAVIIPQAQLLTIQKSAVAVLQPGRAWKAQPFHWKKEPHTRRLNLLVDTVVGYGLTAYSVTAANVASGQEEAARAACLEVVILEVAINGAVGLTLDKRSTGQLAMDRQMLVEMRKRGILPPGFKYGFEWPSIEPALWIADALAGATNRELQGDSRYTVPLGSQLLRRQA